MRSPASSLFDGLIGLLGIAFVFAGGMKLNQPEAVGDLFLSWGLDPDRAVTPAGWVEVVLGAAVFWKPTRLWGGIGLAGWMLIFAPLQLGAGQTSAVVASLTVFLLAVVAAWTVRGADAPKPRIPAPLLDPPSNPGRRLTRLLEIVGLSFLLRWAVGGVLFWSALPALAWSHHRRSEGAGEPFTEILFLYLLVLGVGTSGVWGFVGHTFMAAEITELVGWEPSPFQRELAFYHLGIGVAGLVSWWTRDHFGTAVALIVGIFLLGAGWVHLTDFLQTGNDSPANWGVTVVFGNALVPVVLLALAVRRLLGGRDPALRPRTTGAT